MKLVYTRINIPPVYNKNDKNKLLPAPSVPTLKSTFSNNAHVYYKPGSLPSGGIGTVRNHRMKSYKT